MSIRVQKLLHDFKIDFPQFEKILKTLGYQEEKLTLYSKIPEQIFILLSKIFSKDTDFFQLIEIAAKKGFYDYPKNSSSKLKIVDKIDLDMIYDPTPISKEEINNYETQIHDTPHIHYSNKKSFWISKLVLLSTQKTINNITIGSFDEADKFPLYSLLIGTNGIGKSSLMKEIVDFFIDLHACVNNSDQRLSTNKGRLKGIK